MGGQNFIAWLDGHQALPWKARSDAYYKQLVKLKCCLSLSFLSSLMGPFLPKKVDFNLELSENRSKN
jgi:hypothetical protein